MARRKLSPSSAHLSKDHRFDLGDERVVERLAQDAAEGDQHAAWLLIHQLEIALREKQTSSYLFDIGAVFFARLLDLHESGEENPKELAKAFEALHIVRPRGHPAHDDMTLQMLAARVLLVVDFGYSEDAALGAFGRMAEENVPIVGDEKPFKRGAYRAAVDQYRHAMKLTPAGDLDDPGERAANLAHVEALAGTDTTTLLAVLRRTGGLAKK